MRTSVRGRGKEAPYVGEKRVDKEGEGAGEGADEGMGQGGGIGGQKGARGAGGGAPRCPLASDRGYIGAI